MAAVFPLDTSKPWVFNGVTYEYDASEDRWFVISTVAVDSVVEGVSDNRSQIDVLDTIIDQEIENRTALLDVAASRNNQQDSAINELDARVDALASASGSLQFKGVYTYVLEKSGEACTAAYAQCLVAAGGDAIAMQNCQMAFDACNRAIGDPYNAGSFTSKGTTNVISDIEEFLITTVDANGQTIDWLNVAEEGDYLEFFESDDGDTALYEIVDEPGAFNTEQTIRVKFISQTGTGDGNFNLQTSYDVRIFKASQGIDLTEADLRYVAKPYVVYFEDTPGDITPVHSSGLLRNGELWFDTSSLEMFVWNNNSWVAVTPPPTQDVTIAGVIDDVDRLLTDTAQQSQRVNSLVSDLLLENNIYYSDFPPVGDITGTLRNGDLWVDSDDLSIKFYSMGAWINPDRQVGGDYLEKSGGEITGDLEIMGGPEMGGANIYLWNNGFTRYGWGNTPVELYGGYVYMRDKDHFEIGTYDNKDLKLKAGSIHMNGLNDVRYALTDAHYFRKNVVFNNSSGNYSAKISDSNFDIYNLGRFNQGFVVKASGQGISGANSFASYPAYTTYDGRIENDHDLVNKKYVDDKAAAGGGALVYKAANGPAGNIDWQNSANDGKFLADDLASNNHFWYFSDIDQNGNMLNLREFSSSDKETLYIQIGHYSHTYLNDPNVNRDGMKIVWAGIVEQASRVQTGSIGSKVNTPGWQLFLNRGTGDNPIPAGTITSGGTYYIKFGGLL